MNEIPTTFRAYGRQWAMDAMLPEAEADQRAAALAGRLEPDDIEVRPHVWVSATGESHVMGHLVMTRRWSPVAEATSRPLAEALAEELLAREDITEVVVVERNSAEEHSLTRRGVVKIAEG